MNLEISFGDSNSGLQIAVNNGPLNTQQLHLTGDINIHNITTIRPLAHSIYKSLFNASDLFTQVRDELGHLVSVLIATEEHTPKFRPDDPQLSELDNVLTGCYGVLQDLVRLKEHFDNVGAQTQVTWERMGWGVEELAEIRGKFSLHIQVLNFLNTRMLRSSHENVERMLETFIGEIRSGKRESAAMSCVSSGSLTMDEKEVWRMLRKELQTIGITPDIFTQHRGLILSTLQDFLTQGEIEDFPRGFEGEETKTASEAAVINPGRQLDVPATGSELEPKKRLNVMARLVSRMMRLTTGKSIDREVSKTSTAGLRYQFHGVCMVCLEDIEVPDPSAPASADGSSLAEDLPPNLIYWEYMITPCEHTFHIQCWKQSMGFPSRCPICSKPISFDKESAINPFPWRKNFWDSFSVNVGPNTEEQARQMSTDPIYMKDPSTGQPVVLFTAVSHSALRSAIHHAKGVYPDLTYTRGEIFGVLAQRGKLWLAFNQEDPARTIGWVWEMHFRRIRPDDY